eukprot:scaffold91817_cov75-Phaeocystis_antarctica.AAC.7
MEGESACVATQAYAPIAHAARRLMLVAAGAKPAVRQKCGGAREQEKVCQRLDVASRGVDAAASAVRGMNGGADCVQQFGRGCASLPSRIKCLDGCGSVAGHEDGVTCG